MKTGISGHRLVYLITVLCLLPLFFIRVNNFHDWGDDFAQYLLQAEFLTGKLSQIPVTDVAGYSPDSKGMLFSVYLIPAMFFEGREIWAGKILISLSLLFAGFIFLSLLLRKFTGLVAIITTLIFVYNYHVIGLKDQILPDILLTGCFLAAVLLVERSPKKYSFPLFVLIVLAAGIKSAGIALVLAFLAGSFIHKRRQRPLRISDFKSELLLCVSTVLILCADFIIPGSKPSAIWYGSVTLHLFSPELLWSNLISYKDALERFFEMEAPMWINYLLRYYFFTAIFTGFVLKLIRNKGITEYLIVIYSGILLIYPYQQDPIRFMLPLIPFFIIYILEVTGVLLKILLNKNQLLLMGLFVSCWALLNIHSTRNAISGRPVYETAKAETLQMFDFVKEQIPVSDTICFNKPWALAWFTHRNCVPVTSIHKAQWLIDGNAGVDPGMFMIDPTRKIVFNNSGFRVISIR